MAEPVGRRALLLAGAAAGGSALVPAPAAGREVRRPAAVAEGAPGSRFLLGRTNGAITSLRCRGDTTETDYLAAGAALGPVRARYRRAGGAWHVVDAATPVEEGGQAAAAGVSAAALGMAGADAGGTAGVSSGCEGDDDAAGALRPAAGADAGGVWPAGKGDSEGKAAGGAADRSRVVADASVPLGSAAAGGVIGAAPRSPGGGGMLGRAVACHVVGGAAASPRFAVAGASPAAGGAGAGAGDRRARGAVADVADRSAALQRGDGAAHGAGGGRASQDTLAGADASVGLASRLTLEGEALVWRVEVTNRATEAVEIGELALPLPIARQGGGAASGRS
jgi:hypothetical protein